MACLIYYLPNRTQTVPVSELRSAGLGHALDSMVSAVPITGGPDTKNGVLFTANGSMLGDRLLGYYPEQQTWWKVPKSDAWVGCYDDERPGPDDLLQPKSLDGHFVRLGDGNDWLVPVARARIEQDGELRWHCALPAGVTLDDNGEWCRGGPIAKYETLWSIATRWWDAWTGAAKDDAEKGAGVEFDFDGLNDAALVALQANYRIGKAEVALLRLFDGEPAVAILQALVDWPTVMAWCKQQDEKKKRAQLPATDLAAVGGGNG